MSSFKIEFETDNAAFEGENRPLEVARILCSVACDIKNYGIDVVSKVYDVNGNKIGEVSVYD